MDKRMLAAFEEVVRMIIKQEARKLHVACLRDLRSNVLCQTRDLLKRRKSSRLSLIALRHCGVKLTQSVDLFRRYKSQLSCHGRRLLLRSAEFLFESLDHCSCADETKNEPCNFTSIFSTIAVRGIGLALLERIALETA